MSPESSSDTQYLYRAAPVREYKYSYMSCRVYPSSLLPLFLYPPHMSLLHLPLYMISLFHSSSLHPHPFYMPYPASLPPLSFFISSLKTCPPPAPKSARVGEIGWGVPGLSDASLLKSGNQIIVSCNSVMYHQGRRLCVLINSRHSVCIHTYLRAWY